MKSKWVRKTVGKLSYKGTTEAVKGDKGYELLMDIIDRKVFSVEDERVTPKEFDDLCDWVSGEYSKAKTTNMGGKVVRLDPMLMVEVIGDEPVFVEIHDYKARYRVNMYTETKEVDIQVLEPVKDRELDYTFTSVPLITL